MNNNSKLEDVYFFLLEKTLRQYRKFSNRELSKRGYEISGDQWLVLKRCHEKPGINQKEIADSTYKDPASMTRMIDLLEKKGLIVRKASKQDRRSHDIYLTEEGNSFVEGIIPITEEMRKYGLKNVSEGDQKVFNKVLNQIYENLE